MQLTEIDILEEHPALQLVLAEYRARELAAAADRAEERKQEQRAAQSTDDKPDDGRPPSQDESQDTASDSSPDERWLQRVRSVEGVPHEELSSIHGRLIAWGFLRVQVLGREGLVYQLTNKGKQAAEDRLPPEGGVELPNEAS